MPSGGEAVALRVTIYADGRTAVRAFGQVGQASERTSKQIEKDSRSAQKSWDQMGKGAGRLHGMVGNLAGYIGAGGLALGIKDAIQAGMNWQKQQAQLVGALKNTGQYSKSTMDTLSRGAESLATRGGFGAPENVQALTKFVTATGSASKAQRDLQLSTDIARQSGNSYSRVVRAIMMAEGGRTTGLSRMGIVLGKTTTAEDQLRETRYLSNLGMTKLIASGVKFTAAQKAQYAINHQITPQMLAQAKATDTASAKAQAFALLQAKYQGATQRYSKTSAGAVSNLKNSFEELEATIGQKLLPIINTLVKFLDKHKTAVVVLALALGGLALAWATVTAATAAWGAATTIAAGIATGFEAIMGVLRTATLILGLSFTEMGIEAAAAWAMATLGVSLIIAAIVMLVMHFNTVWNWVKKNWPLLAGIILMPFIGPIGIIVALFHKQLLGAAKAVWNWIKGAANTLFQALIWPYKQAWNIIKGIWNWIKGAANSVWSWLKGAAHSVWDALTWPYKQAWKIIQTIFGAIKSGFKEVLSIPGKIIHGIGNVAKHIPIIGGLFGQQGGIVPTVRHMQVGGILGGFGGGDRVPLMAEPGEGVMRKESVQSIGTQAFNAINATGSLPGGGGTRPDEVYVAAPIRMIVGQRVMAEQTVHFVARRNALSGQLAGAST